MNRIFFFQKRNTRTGELLDEYVDSDEGNARYYATNPRHFLYVGWSDGRFINPLKQRLTYDEKTGMAVPLPEEHVLKLRQAAKDELEFAKTNPDKRGPRDFSKVDINGGLLNDPYLMGTINSRKNG